MSTTFLVKDEITEIYLVLPQYFQKNARIVENILKLVTGIFFFFPMSVRCHVIDVPSALPLSVCSALGRDKWRQTRIFNILGTAAVHSSTLFTSMVFNLLYLHKIKMF